MKKIVLAVTTAFVTFAQVNVAEARYQNSNHYSSEYNEFPDPITELLNGADWTQSFVRQYRAVKKPYYKHTYNRYFAPKGHINGSIVSFGRLLQREGFRVSEHPAFGGVHRHSHQSHHYSGNALDVNVVAGIDYANPRARHKLDSLASRARAVGYTVLWKVAGHFNHLHLQR